MEEEKRIIAIMGPSGAGKTTLGNLLSKKNNIVVPRHVTTRNKRCDDADGFYRYVSHEEFNQYNLNGEFLLFSGDGPIISPIYGNFYGVLNKDCNQAWQISRDILLYTSYKDIETLISLRKKYDVQILNITFNDISNGVRNRLINDKNRDSTKQDIESRIYWALSDEKHYRKIIDNNSNGVIYTDIYGIDETYDKACRILKLERK